MPARKAAAVAEPVETERDLSTYLNKKATPLQARFPVWLREEVGADPASMKTKDEAFNEGVRLATALRMAFQASDFNREATAEERGAAEAVPAKKAAAPKKTARVAAPAAEAAPAPAKKAAPAGRRRAASAAPRVDNEDVPF